MQKSSRPCENSMRGSVRSRREPIFAIFSALRGYRPRNLGTAQRVAEFSHGLQDFWACPFGRLLGATSAPSRAASSPSVDAGEGALMAGGTAGHES